MARVTVEDCIEKVSNRFELVLVAAQRARKLGSGAHLTVDRDNDKNPVVSLREIAAETVDIEDLREEIVRSHQRMVASEEDETIDLMDGEEEWGTIAAKDSSESEGGLYADEDIVEEGDEEPSLADVAGKPQD